MLLIIIISSVVVCRVVLSNLKGAPIPISGYTLSHTLWGAVLSRAEDTANGAPGSAPTIDNGCCWCDGLLLRALAV
jgi:hypothetical protein